MVWFVPAVGAAAIYIVAASVVVTDEFVAASVGAAIELNTAAVAVPLPAVALSVKVDEASDKY